MIESKQKSKDNNPILEEINKSILLINKYFSTDECLNKKELLYHIEKLYYIKNILIFECNISRFSKKAKITRWYIYKKLEMLELDIEDIRELAKSGYKMSSFVFINLENIDEVLGALDL